MASPMPAAPCEWESSALRSVVITKKRRHRRRRRARTRDADGPPAVPPHPNARVPAHQQLGSQLVVRVPMHQCLGSKLPQHHVPRAGMPVITDGFALVQSCWRWDRRAPPHPYRQRPVLPSLIGLYFNYFSRNHITAQCTFPSRCLFCLSTEHRARNYKPLCLSLDQVREPPRRGPCHHAAGGNHGRSGSHLRRLGLGHDGDIDDNDGDSHDADGTPEPQVEPRWGLTF